MASFNDALSRDKLLHEGTDQPRGDTVPGYVCLAATISDALTLPSHVQGKVAVGEHADAWTLDTVLFLASATKPITVIAALQCVERGQIGLDDSLKTHLPELGDLQVLVGWKTGPDGRDEPVLREAEEEITLRRLLSHTSGISAAIFDPVYQKYNDWKGWEQRNPRSPETMKIPLRFEPGSKWCYGMGVDWAGLLVTRLNNCTLGTYFQKHIFDPLGMTSTTFRPLRNDNIKNRLASISVRAPDGSFKPGSMDVWLKDSEEIEMEPGGYGLYSTASDYIKFLNALLPPPSSAPTSTSTPILSQTLITEMLDPQFPSSTWLTSNATDPKLIKISGNILDPSSPVNHGFGVLIHESDLEGLGTKAGTAEGAGMTNTFWWVDRKSGVAGLCFMNLLPYMDTGAVDVYREYVKEVYERIGKV